MSGNPLISQSHTEPLFAALMAGEFLVVGGNGDVYSIEDAQAWLEKSVWRFIEHSLGPSLGREFPVSGLANTI